MELDAITNGASLLSAMLPFENSSPWILPFCIAGWAFLAPSAAKSRLERMIFKAKCYCLVNTSRLDALAQQVRRDFCPSAVAGTVALLTTRMQSIPAEPGCPSLIPSQYSTPGRKAREYLPIHQAVSVHYTKRAPIGKVRQLP